MKYRRKSNKKKQSTSSWINTYADMITLVLVFFILLFSISQIDAEKFQTVAQSYRDRVIFDFQPSIVPAETPSELGDTIDNPDEDELASVDDESEEQDVGEEQGLRDQEDELAKVMEEVNKFLLNEGLQDVITANRTDRGVVLILSEKILFESGEANIIDEGKPFLDKVGKLLSQIPNDVKVEGHTDSRPIATYRYPSNWELSSARASSVIRYLTENNTTLDSERFQSSGFADTRPVAENNSDKNMQKNRRVEIVILEPEQEKSA
ncbi:flagellar motor protein MotS [Salirhabdus sp. Marseille-P4669]|uniref:flagellar motor protein MotS n=1 Tax=Salirhabdus sp. Marseille-P4669 TaxID=2042310 RepID=UPI000C7C141F|nr:flagellar motor protein MotS [Salirhabdus sp. Marseille-P4669]